MLLFMDKVAVPALIVAGLVGCLAGAALGCALVFNHVSALRFISRVNRWVSTQETFARLEKPITVEPAAGAGGRRPLLGTVFLLVGVLGAALLVWRLNFAQPAFNLKSSPLLLIALETIKWTLVAGSAFAALVGALMIVAPSRLAQLELKLNDWRSTERLAAATDRVHTPLEPIVEAYPRASGCVIALVCLLVAWGMAYLLILNLH